MDLLKRVGEMNRDHWLIEILGPRLGVLARLVMRSFNPFAWGTIGADSLIFFVWLVPLAVLGRFLGVPDLQGAPAPFFWTVGLLFALGLFGLYSELQFMDRHEGRPRSMLRGMNDEPAAK